MTAAPSVQDFLDFFGALTAQGYEIVHLDISAELSGTFNAASIAAQELEGVYTVDSRMLSSGVALLAIEAADCRDRGMSAAEIAEHVSALTAKVDTSFVLDTLEFMWKGGRCKNISTPSGPERMPTPWRAPRWTTTPTMWCWPSG